MDPTTAAFLSGLDAGRFQGYQNGRDAGYREGYDAGHLDGAIAGWRAAGADERRRFELYTPPGPSHALLTRLRSEHHPVKPVKSPAECLATWSTP